MDINFGKSKFCLNLHSNGDNSYLFVNGKEIYKIKASMLMLIFHLNFAWEAYLINLAILKQKKRKCV